MLKIEWEIDKNFEIKIDPEELLGKIKIISHNNMIYDDCIYLNVWFGALISGYFQMLNNKYLKYDLGSEPKDLIFDPREIGFAISYGDSLIIIDSIEKYQSELLKSAKLFLNEIQNAFDKKNVFLLDEIISFIEKSKNIPK